MPIERRRRPAWTPPAIPALAASLLLAGCSLVDRLSSGAEVWTDGAFDEWEDVAPAVYDRIGDTPRGSPVDLGPVVLRDDSRFLHLLIDLGRTVTVQGMAGTVEVVLDADGDAATGGAYGGVEGADLAIVLSRGAGAADESRGAGVGIRRIGADGPGEVEGSAAVGLLVSPTHSSDRFEVRVMRGVVGEARREVGVGQDVEAGGGREAGDDRSAAAAGGGREPGASPDAVAGSGVHAGQVALALDSVVAGRLRFMRAGEMVDETPVFRHVLTAEPGGEPPLLRARDVAKARGAHRVVVWNVSDHSFRENRRAFQRVVAGLGADVVLLDEVYADVTEEELAGFGAGVPGAWSWWLASGGGRQRTVVGARGLDLRGEDSLRRIEYAPGALAGWLGGVGDRAEARGMALPSELGMAEEEGGLSATGAWVTIDGLDVLFVPVDLQSAGFDGSPRDRLRELQARTLNQAVAAALAERPDAGVVIGGDLNLVGSARPLDELRRGLGAGKGVEAVGSSRVAERSDQEVGDGGSTAASAPDLSVVRLERLRDRSLATWRSTWGDDPFSPGRLDFVLYRREVLAVAKAFVFDAADLSAEALRELGLRESDTGYSDHLPLVVDFRVR